MSHRIVTIRPLSDYICVTDCDKIHKFSITLLSMHDHLRSSAGRPKEEDGDKKSDASASYLLAVYIVYYYYIVHVSLCHATRHLRFVLFLLPQFISFILRLVHS